MKIETAEGGPFFATQEIDNDKARLLNEICGTAVARAIKQAQLDAFQAGRNQGFEEGYTEAMEHARIHLQIAGGILGSDPPARVEIEPPAEQATASETSPSPESSTIPLPYWW